MCDFCILNTFFILNFALSWNHWFIYFRKRSLIFVVHPIKDLYDEMLMQKLSAPSSIKIFWEIDISFTDIFSKWNMNQEKLVANNRCRLLMLTRSCKAPFSISKFFNNQLHRMSKRIQAMKTSLKLLFFHNVFKKTPKLLIKKKNPSNYSSMSTDNHNILIFIHEIIIG